MSSKDWVGVVLGLVGIGASLHAVVTGSIDVHLFRWGRYWHKQHSVDVTFRRDESPVAFWAAAGGVRPPGPPHPPRLRGRGASPLTPQH